MANFEADGPSVAEWRPVEGQHVKMFTNASAEQDLGSATKILQNTWLLSARVIEHKNTFPIPLGINVSCIHGQEHIDTGENYTFTALPMTHNPTPLSIFEADASAQTSALSSVPIARCPSRVITLVAMRTSPRKTVAVPMSPAVAVPL